MDRSPRRERQCGEHAEARAHTVRGAGSFDGNYGIRVAAGTPDIENVTVDHIGTNGAGVGVLLLGNAARP